MIFVNANFQMLRYIKGSAIGRGGGGGRNPFSTSRGETEPPSTVLLLNDRLCMMGSIHTII